MTEDARMDGDVQAIEARLLTFVHRELLAEGVAVDRETDLLTGDLLDSMSVLRLAAFVGESFGVDVGAADLLVENFRNVRVIAAYARRRLGESRP